MQHHDLGDVFRQHYLPLRLRGRSPATIDRYTVELRRFERFLARPPVVADLNDITVSRLLDWMTKTGAAPATVNTCRAKLVAFASFLHLRKMLDQPLDVPTLTEPVRIPTAWTVDEIRRLVAACDEWTRYLPNGIVEGLWWRSILLTLYDSGERIGAVLAARWSELSAPHLTLPAESRKNGTSDMVHKLRPSTLDAIELIREPSRDLIWEWPKSTTMLYKRFDALVSQAGLPVSARSKFHKLRRSTATHVEAAGGDATLAMGHTSRAVTVKHYIDPRQVPRVFPSDLLPEVAG